MRSKELSRQPSAGRLERKHQSIRKRRLTQNAAPKYKFKDNKISKVRGELDHALADAECFGSVDIDFGNHLVHQLARMNLKDSVSYLNAAKGFLFELKPNDSMEALLLTQAFVSHGLAMTFASRANMQDDPDLIDRNINRMNKLMRTFAQHLETLNRHRGKGQQKVTVEHVTVNHGGQAIVGTISKGEGANEET